MKNLSDRYPISSEVIAAYLDGKATPSELVQIMNAVQADSHLREVLQVSLSVDAEMGLLLHRTNHIPTSAMAAECAEGSFCCLECEKWVLRRRGICYDEQVLLENALRNGWLKEEGTALHHVGKHLEDAGLVVNRHYDYSLSDIVDALAKGCDVIVAVDGGELLGNIYIEAIEDTCIGEIPDHTVVVVACDMAMQTITLFDPNSEHIQDKYPFAQFANAWADAKNYAVIVE